MEKTELFTHDINGLKKLESIKRILDNNLPFPKTIFVFDCKKQEKEIEEFIKNRKYVMIRSDKRDAKLCPHYLKCPRNEAMNFIRKLNSDGYVAIVHDLSYLKNYSFDDEVSGNVLLLKNHFIIEVVKGGPLTKLNRFGEMDESIRINRHSFEEVAHSGKRIIDKERLNKVLKMVNHLPAYKLVEFALGDDWLYFWQIRDEETARELDD